MPAESLDDWRRWWERIKRDRVSQIDLGLLPAPDASKLSGAELGEWMERLDSANRRHARVARRVLRELPDSRIPEVVNRASAPTAPAGVRTMAERLLLRSRGRVLYVSDLGGSSTLYVMRLDGSGARKISGDLKEASWAQAGAGSRWVYGEGTSRDGGKAIYRFDLRGDRAPEKISERSGSCWVSPGGDALAVLDCREKTSFHLIDLGTGKDTDLGDGGGLPAWSPDGLSLAWTSHGTLFVLPKGDPKPTSQGDCDLCRPVSWSSDSRFLAFCRRDLKGDLETWRCQVEVVEAASGKRHVAAGPAWMMSDPEWSPQGSRFVVAACAREGPGIIEVHDPSGDGLVMRASPLKSVAGIHGSCQWMGDGKMVAYRQLSDYSVKGKTIGENAAAFIEVPSGAVRAVHRQLPYFFEPLPNLDWVLAPNGTGDLLLWSYDGSRSISLTESPAGSLRGIFLPPE